MSDTIRTKTDERLRNFFRDSILSEPGMTGEKAEQLADRCVQSIDRVLTGRDGPAVTGAPGARQQTGIAAGGTPPLPGFDPFAFSAVSVLARKGREALLARLGEIPTADNLREFALAQHIAIDQSLTGVDELRIAIIRGTERRIAARRAAAS